MSNSVGTINNQTAPAQNPASANASANVNAAAQPSFKSQVPTTVQPTAPRDGDAPISPRIVVDPLAGPITEFLTTSGTVQAQIPSAAVVAYLRAGLTAEGYAKPTVESPHPEKTPAVTTTNNNNKDDSTGASVAGATEGHSVVA